MQINWIGATPVVAGYWSEMCAFLDAYATAQSSPGTGEVGCTSKEPSEGEYPGLSWDGYHTALSVPTWSVLYLAGNVHITPEINHAAPPVEGFEPAPRGRQERDQRVRETCPRPRSRGFSEENYETSSAMIRPVAKKDVRAPGPRCKNGTLNDRSEGTAAGGRRGAAGSEPR